MIYLIILAIFLVSLFLWLMIDVRKSAHMLYIIPLTILFTGGSYFYIDSLFGYPTSLTNEKKFMLISFLPDEDNDNIFMWVLLEGDKEPKSIQIPYSKEQHKALAAASEGMKEGRRYIGEFDPELQGNGQEEEENGSPGTQAEESAGGTIKSKGGSFALLELDVEATLPKKAGHAEYEN